MNNKSILTFLVLIISGCVDDYEIEPFVDQKYEAYGNLGFEQGLDHWSGKANSFSSIAIDSDSYEGQNSLKLSISMDSTSSAALSDPVIAEISKSLDVSQGDTISMTYQILCNNEDLGTGINLFGSQSFYDTAGYLIHQKQDTIIDISTQWQMINTHFSIPQNATELVFAVTLKALPGSHEDIYILLDDFSINTTILINQTPSNFSLLSPDNNSLLSTDEQINFSWESSIDQDNDPIKYDLQIWTDAVVGNYLTNNDLENVSTHWLGADIPTDWDYWPYYFHNVFSYPQLSDSVYNQDYIKSGERSMWITGDFNGQSNKTILYQAFYTDYIPPGTRVTFSGYMLNPSTDPIQNNNQGYISIDQFSFSGSNNAWLINHSSESITNSHPIDEWHYFEVSSVTEENIDFLQIRINYEQFNDDSGTVFIDDLMITTSNSHLILFETENIEAESVSVDRTVFTDPYNFGERESLVYYWNVSAKDDFSSITSQSGPCTINLNP